MKATLLVLVSTVVPFGCIVLAALLVWQLVRLKRRHGAGLDLVGELRDPQRRRHLLSTLAGRSPVSTTPA